MIEWVALTQLSAHPRNAELYGDGADADLIESVRQLGIQQALYVRADGTIISGHRRWLAARAAGLRDIPVIRVSYPSPTDEDEAIVEHNRYRKKTGEQLYREGKLLTEILGERRGQRMDPQEVQTFAPVGKTRQIIATRIGLGSGPNWDKLRYIGEAADAGNSPAQEVLAKIGSSQSLDSAYREVRRALRPPPVPAAPIGDIGTGYQLIYADPPWQYQHAVSDSRAIEKHYPTMNLDSICGLPVMERCAPDAVLFLWATNPKLEEALTVLRTWGFSYRTNMVWVKDRIGMGYYARQQHELLLVGRRGDFPAPPPVTRSSSVLEFPRGKEHSHKPDEVSDLLVRMYPDAKKVELFARKERPGWTCWGQGLQPLE